MADMMASNETSPEVPVMPVPVTAAADDAEGAERVGAEKEGAEKVEDAEDV